MRKIPLFFTLVWTLTIRAQAVQPCNADQPIQLFQKSVNSLILQIPALSAEVDNCFNLVDHPKYAEEAKRILSSLEKAYRTSIQDLGTAKDHLKSGHDSEFKSKVAHLVREVQVASAPLFKNAGNLKAYGFTVDDTQRAGTYKYPNCNSSKNNKPEQRWSQAYQTALRVQNAGQSLLATVACLP